MSSAKKIRFPSIPGVFPQSISHSFFKLFLRKDEFLWNWTQQVVEPLKNYWCLSTLKLFSPTQLTANHRTDHLCWDQLWPMRETKLTGVNIASSCLSSPPWSPALLLPLSLYIKLPVFLFAGLAAHSRSFTLSLTFPPRFPLLSFFTPSSSHGISSSFNSDIFLWFWALKDSLTSVKILLPLVFGALSLSKSLSLGAIDLHQSFLWVIKLSSHNCVLLISLSEL